MMETKQEHNAPQAGNAMIYVLIVIALFAALAFVLSRQSHTSENSTLGTRQVEIDATQILQPPMQIKQAVDSMIFGGTTVDALDFILPGAAGYDNAPRAAKVFHPDGGGVVMPKLPEDADGGGGSDPAPGWYLGRFNNVEWTPTTATDVVLTAWHISKQVCARIDEKLTGSSTIPVASHALRDMLVDAANHTGLNTDFTAANCAGCDGKPALCVEDPSHSIWAFYSVMEGR